MEKTKWISIKDKLPEIGAPVLVWKTNPENPHWNTYGIGHYENNKFYLRSGTNSWPVVTHWAELPERLS